MDPGCPSTGRHGTAAAYCHDGCRCAGTRKLRSIAEKKRQLALLAGRPLTVPAEGCRRRIRALYWLGWNAPSLAKELGIGEYRVHILSGTKQKRVRRETHELIDGAYRVLSGRAGPSPYTAGQARQRGYAPPVAWDYCNIDDPAAQPWQGFA